MGVEHRLGHAAAEARKEEEEATDPKQAEPLGYKTKEPLGGDSNLLTAVIVVALPPSLLKHRLDASQTVI